MDNKQDNQSKRKYFFVNPFEKQKEKNPMKPSYIKPDGTEVIELQEDFGLRVL